MAFSNMATLCNPSTFCLYPTMASTNLGLFVASPQLVPHAAALSAKLPPGKFRVVQKPPMVTYRALHGKAGDRDCPATDHDPAEHPELRREAAGGAVELL